MTWAGWRYSLLWRSQLVRSMSVINTMLQSWTSATGGRAAGAGRRRDSLDKPSSAWPLRQSVLLVLMCLVTVSAAGAWWLQHRARPAMSPTPVQPSSSRAKAAGHAPRQLQP
jgi:hypothetical protein